MTLEEFPELRRNLGVIYLYYSPSIVHKLFTDLNTYLLLSTLFIYKWDLEDKTLRKVIWNILLLRCLWTTFLPIPLEGSVEKGVKK